MKPIHRKWTTCSQLLSWLLFNPIVSHKSYIEISYNFRVKNLKIKLGKCLLKHFRVLFCLIFHLLVKRWSQPGYFFELIGKVRQASVAYRKSP
jgi:hypothetical protein